MAAGPPGARHPRAAVVAERRHHFDLIQERNNRRRRRKWLPGDLMDQAISVAEETEERLSDAELHRLRGELLIQSGTRA